jgi:acyl-CoA thioesterase FadM
MSDTLQIPTEAVVSLAPFRVERRTRWSECDPAGVVFAGQFPLYMLSAAHLFRTHVLNAPIGRQTADQGYGTPGKAMEMVFMGPLWPDDAFVMELHVGRIGKRTTDLLIDARRCDDGTPVFMGRLSSIYVQADDRKVSIPIPENVRTILNDYQRAIGPIPHVLEQVMR